jgi:cytochrome c oxidase cbb3-type subunit III
MLVSLLAYAQQQKASRRELMTSPGRQIFASNCAACHGLDGTGNQRAPNIVGNPQIQKLSPQELLKIVSQGVPGTGMPAFASMGRTAVREVTAYLRLLQGQSLSAALPGDPQRGEAIFFGKGACSNCHMAEGKGGFLASDLTTYGQSHTAETIKGAITSAAVRNSNPGMVTAITTRGQRYEGIVRNEDNFSLQLQSADGAFYFLSKADLKTLERAPESIMPADYGSRLSEVELNDLVNYLVSLGKRLPAIARGERND